MAGEIRLDIAADTRSAVRGVENVGKALDAVVDDLEQVNRESGQTEDALTADFRKIANAADRAGDEIKRDLSGAFKEARSEASQSGREAAASFSGGFEDVADFVQETVANAFGGFGPIGAAAGVAIAAGIGAALQGLADQQEKLEAAREAARDLAQTLYENNGRLPVEEQVSRLFDLLNRERRPRTALEGIVDQWADFGTVLDAVKGTAEQTRIPLSTLIRGLSGGDLRSTRDALEGVNEQLAALEDQAARGYASWGDFLRAGQTQTQLEAVRSELEGVVAQSDLARSSMAAVGSAYDGERQRQLVEDLASAWENAATNASDYITETENGPTFDVSAYLAAAEAEIAAADEVKRDLVTLPPNVREEALRIYRESGATASKTYIDAYQSAAASDRARLEAAAKANGSAAGAAQGQAMAKAAEQSARATAQGLGPIPLTARITVDDTAVRNYRGRVNVTGNIVFPPGARQAV